MQKVCSSSTCRHNSAQGGHVTSPSFLEARGISSEEGEFLDLESSARQHVREDIGVHQSRSARQHVREDIGVDRQEREDSSLVSDLCSPSSLATRLGLIPTPQREAYILSLLSNEKCSVSFNKVIEPARHSLIFVITPSTLPQTPTLHPFHHHLPHYNNGQYRNVGKDVSSFNLHRASKEAAKFQETNSSRLTS